MNDVVPEYRHSVHYMNRSGVKADCAIAIYRMNLFRNGHVKSGR